MNSLKLNRALSDMGGFTDAGLQVTEDEAGREYTVKRSFTEEKESQSCHPYRGPIPLTTTEMQDKRALSCGKGT